MRTTTVSRKLLAAAVALSLGLGACSDDNTGPGGPNNPGGNPDTPGGGPNGGLSASQVQAVGATASEELDESFAAVVAVSAANPFESAIDGFSLPGRIPACASTDPATPEDPDADEVPTTVTISFADCARTGPNGASIDFSGSLTVTDPNPTSAGIDVTVTADELAYEHVRAGGATIAVTRDGTRSLTGGANGVSTSEDLVVTREASGSETTRVTKEGTRTFTPDAGLSIVPGEERPSGTITVDGSFAWERGDDTFNFAVDTETPLHYNATCTDQPRGRRIDAGVIVYTRTFEGRTETIRLTFTACGTAPTIEHQQAS